MTVLTIGSLFSGIGGLELGLEYGLGNSRTAFQVEIDHYCLRVLERHWPDALRFEDIHDVGRHNLPWVHILCGGFPCQDISLAGTGAGLEGQRSGLWSEYLRVIRELRPAYVVVENVSALLARGLGRVLGDLAESGYDAWWDCIPASAVGAPHRRDRVFIVAYPNVRSLDQRDFDACDGGAIPSEGEQRFFHGGYRGEGIVSDADSAGFRERWRTIAVSAQLDPAERVRETDKGRTADDSMRGRHEPSTESVRAGRDSALDASWWTVEPDVGRVAHGIPSRVDRLRGLGNAVVPHVGAVLGRLIRDHWVSTGFR